MKFRLITDDDCIKYRSDIKSAYESNHLIFDSRNPYKPETEEECARWVINYCGNSQDSFVYGIFDDREDYLYGIIIFDNVRITKENSCAQVHIVNDKSIFGRKVKGVYEDLIIACGINTIYAEIPQNAVHAIAMCKRLGFKKTGYIPKALPYININGEEKMHDIQIYTYIRP